RDTVTLTLDSKSDILRSMNVRSFRRACGWISPAGICVLFLLRLDREPFTAQQSTLSRFPTNKASEESLFKKGTEQRSLSNPASAAFFRHDLETSIFSAHLVNEHVNRAFLTGDLQETKMADGRLVKFCPEMILVKFVGDDSVRALRVERNTEV